MTNILGEDIYNYRDKEFKKDEYFHDYNKKESKIGRKMGHFTKILA
jgi:5-(carboxyamino)imidazole ribonucleotide synthase